MLSNKKVLPLWKAGSGTHTHMTRTRDGVFFHIYYAQNIYLKFYCLKLNTHFENGMYEPEQFKEMEETCPN